jgi:hypothetical protein
VRPTATLRFAGVTPTETKAGAVTVSGVVPDTPLKAAVTVAVPGAFAVATPVLLMEAML